MLKRLICLLLALLMCPCLALAEAPRNTVGITLYDQDRYTGGEWALAGYEGRDLASSGCFLFAFGHAVQYLTGENTDDGLICTLLGVCCDPNGNYGHAKCTHLTMSGPAFYVFNKKLGFPIENASFPALHENGHVKDWAFATFFAREKRALCLHGGGHHVLAVDEQAVDGVSYVHIIDSHWGSVEEKCAVTYYVLEDGHMQPIAVDADTYGFAADYWLEAQEVEENFKLIFAWKQSR